MRGPARPRPGSPPQPHCEGACAGGGERGTASQGPRTGGGTRHPVPADRVFAGGTSGRTTTWEDHPAVRQASRGTAGRPPGPTPALRNRLHAEASSWSSAAASPVRSTPSVAAPTSRADLTRRAHERGADRVPARPLRGWLGRGHPRSGPKVQGHPVVQSGPTDAEGCVQRTDSVISEGSSRDAPTVRQAEMCRWVAYRQVRSWFPWNVSVLASTELYTQKSGTGGGGSVAALADGTTVKATPATTAAIDALLNIRFQVGLMTPSLGPRRERPAVQVRQKALHLSKCHT